MAPAPIAGDGVEEEDDDEESGELVDWETLPFAQNDNWEVRAPPSSPFWH